MKENRKKYLTKKDYEKFDITDTRYFGLFCSGNRGNFKSKIDIKRFQKSTFTNLTKEQLEIINKRKTHYYYPAKPTYDSYKCNIVKERIDEIKNQWDKYYKPLVFDVVNKVNKPKDLSPGDVHLFNCGVLEPDEVGIVVNYENVMSEIKYNYETNAVICSQYSQFILLFASQIEALTLEILDYNKYFDRNVLYNYKLKDNKSVKDLPSFSYHNKLYILWNFIKHNSISTFKKVKDNFPDLLIDVNQQFHTGDLAIYYLNLSDKLIEELFYGIQKFFEEFCINYFRENIEEAQWNYGYYFYDIVKDQIDTYTNPLGIPDYL